MTPGGSRAGGDDNRKPGVARFRVSVETKFRSSPMKTLFHYLDSFDPAPLAAGLF
jgi:hypothetical protein